MTACQSDAAGFIAASLRDNRSTFTPVSPQTFAISIGDPLGNLSILTAIRNTGGDAWEAPDSALLEAVALLGQCGICAEGASAASIATLQQQVQIGAIDPNETIVAVICGSGMKWPAQLHMALATATDDTLLPDDVSLLLSAVLPKKI
jgi:threonine synthase